MNKTNFINRNFFAVFKTLQVLFILLACADAAYHDWFSCLADLLFAVCIEIFMMVEGKNRKNIKNVDVVFSWEHIDDEPDEETDEDYPANLDGRVVKAAQKCDNCTNETDDCKKLILADGSHICMV